MSLTRRLSMNTSLREARIFDDDDANECDTKPDIKIKVETNIKEEIDYNEYDIKDINIKLEKDVEDIHIKKEDVKTSLISRSTKRSAEEDEHQEPDHTPQKRRYFHMEEPQVVPFNRNRKFLDVEKDPVILRRRQKQIDYGKNTIGYDNYVIQVPRDKRTKDDPQTPDKYAKYSRRAWDGLIKQWRVKLHKYD